METEHKLVVVARKDLKLAPGKLAAQVGHASVDCALRAQLRKPRVFEAWLSQGQKKVVVKVASLRELQELRVACDDAGLITALIADAGHTELEPGTVTCLGVGPAAEKDVDRLTGHLALF
ncbi:MAG: peptidyl-tRNA hydrolase Pth2 [Methanobacteriota archaeon]